MVYKGKTFVTVGNGKFDPMIREIDRLVGSGLIFGEVVCQIGHGKYEPKNCKWYRFKPSLSDDEKWADVVVSHGGPGCVFELLMMSKKVIAVPNRNRTDVNHQVEFLRGLYKEGERAGGSYFIYCDEVSRLQEWFSRVGDFVFSDYVRPDCSAAFLVQSFIASKVQK